MYLIVDLFEIVLFISFVFFKKKIKYSCRYYHPRAHYIALHGSTRAPGTNAPLLLKSLLLVDQSKIQSQL